MLLNYPIAIKPFGASLLGCVEVKDLKSEELFKHLLIRIGNDY